MSGSQVVDPALLVLDVYYSASTSAQSAQDQTNFTPGGAKNMEAISDAILI